MPDRSCTLSLFTEAVLKRRWKDLERIHAMIVRYAVPTAGTKNLSEIRRSDLEAIRFADRETALAWYNSPGCQATLVDRVEGIDCRFQLIG